MHKDCQGYCDDCYQDYQDIWLEVNGWGTVMMDECYSGDWYDSQMLLGILG